MKTINLALTVSDSEYDELASLADSMDVELEQMLEDVLRVRLCLMDDSDPN